MKIILASTSPFRKQLLTQYHFLHEAHSPDFDEEHFKSNSHNPQQLAELLAQGKAESLSHKFKELPILGGDQLVHINGEILGKAKHFDEALKQLKKLSGQTHELITSICLHYKGVNHIHTDITQLKMRNLSDEVLSQYLKFEEPYNCAGSYKIETSGLKLFNQIKTEDSTSIIGIPIMGLTNLMIKISGEISFKPLE